MREVVESIEVDAPDSNVAQTGEQAHAYYDGDDGYDGDYESYCGYGDDDGYYDYDVYY